MSRKKRRKQALRIAEAVVIGHRQEGDTTVGGRDKGDDHEPGHDGQGECDGSGGDEISE